MSFAVYNFCGFLTAFYPNIGKPCVFAIAALRNVIDQYDQLRKNFHIILEHCDNHKGLYRGCIVVHSITTTMEHELLAMEDFNKA